jgi:hypothetical protein
MSRERVPDALLQQHILRVEVGMAGADGGQSPDERRRRREGLGATDAVSGHQRDGEVE